MVATKQEIRFCTSADGVRIAYATCGSGPRLVRASTYLTHLEHDWNSPVWRHWLTGLARNFTLVRHDQRGCGLSDWNVSDFSMDAWVADLEAVVDDLGLERFHLLGPSQGGAVAIEYAVRHPERVSSLILYGAYAQGRFHRSPAAEHREEAEAMLRLMRVGWGRNNPAFRQVFSTLFMPQATQEQMTWFNDLQQITTSPENAVAMERAFYEIDVRAAAAKVATPTLVMHAQQDAMVSFEQGRALAALIPNAKFVPLDSPNHLLLQNEPAWDQFMREVLDFIGEADPELEPAGPGITPLTLFDELTEREREVLELVAEGLTNDQISERLVISPKTVRNHVSRVYSKLGVSHRAQAIVRARQAGMGRGP